MKKRVPDRILNSPRPPLPSRHCHSILPPFADLSRPTVSPQPRGLFPWKDSRVFIIFPDERRMRVSSNPLSPFPSLTRCWITVEARVAANKWIYAEKRGANWTWFFFSRGETVAKERGARVANAGGKREESLITVMHWMDAPVASKQAFFYRVLREINLPRLPVEFSSFYGSFASPFFYLTHSLSPSLALSAFLFTPRYCLSAG